MSCHRMGTAGAVGSLGAWVVVSAMLVMAAATAQAQDLDRLVRDAMATTPLGRAKIGICVVDGDTGKELVSINASDTFIPASNMKLITSGAALHVLGTDFVFRTRVMLIGDELVIEGAGDPALADPELLADMMPSMSCEQFIDRLAEVIVDNGVKSLSGIVVDDRIFEPSAVHPTWPANQLNNSYCAEISGLNFHANVLNVYARPDGDRSIRVETDPVYPKVMLLPSVELVPTKSRGRQESIWMTRKPGTNRVRISGRISRPTVSPVAVTIHDPAMQFGTSLAVALARRGVLIGGSDSEVLAPDSVRHAQQSDPIDALRAAASEIVVVQTPIEVVLERCNTNSENMYAESLLKRMGHEVTLEPGSWENGTATMRMVIADVLDARSVSALIAADGSGMSRSNLVTPEFLASWIRAVSNDSRIGEAWLESLAEPGVGTLRERFRNTRTLDNHLYAKTGYLTGVRSISGVLEDESTGHRLVFSLLMNDEMAVDANAKLFQEKFVLVLDQWLTQSAFVSAREE